MTTNQRPIGGSAIDIPTGGLLGRIRRIPPGLRYGVGIPLIVVLVVAALVGVDLVSAAERVHPGVTLGGVAVGGMSVEDARGVVERELVPLLDQSIVVRCEGRSWSVTSAGIGASLDVAGLVDEAYAVGRTGNAVERISDRMLAWLGKRDVEAVAELDALLAAAFLDSVDSAVGTPSQDATVAIDGTTPRLVAEVIGRAVDREDAKAVLARAALSRERVVDLSLVDAPAVVDEGHAQDALEDAQRMLSGDLTLYYEDETWVLTARDIASWIAFRVSDAGMVGSQSSVSTQTATEPQPTGEMVLEAYLDSEEISATVAPLTGGIGRPAVDASFDASEGRVTIVPGEDGLGLDVEGIALGLREVLIGSGPREFELRMKRIPPKLTTADAEQMGIVERISTFTTTYSAGNKPRVNNIHVLADAIDNTLVAPGETWSFNETVGQRTAEKGYQEAPAIIGGELVNQLGGGICQVGTTMFNTIFFSGFPVVERHNHSLYISHYPTGRDATISWGGPDLKFTNDSDKWVLIATSYTSSSVTISLYGTDPGYDVTYETGPWTNIRAYPVREVPDATLPIGTRVVEQQGVTGRRIVVTRVVKKGGTVVRTDEFASVYQPVEEVVRVGTMGSVPTTPTP